MLRRIGAVMRTAIAVPTFFVVTLGFAAWVLVLVHIDRDSPLIERTIQVWSRRFLGIAPVDLTVLGREKVDPDGQYVFAANHLSNFDIPVMFLTAPVPIRYLAKKELFRIPILASAMREIGIIETDRRAATRAHALINAGVASAKERGHSLIVFPEGTRSDDGELHDFKKGAFRIAISNQLAVVPVTINGTWEVWPPGSRVLHAGKATTTIHDPISTEGLAVGDIDELRAKVHAAVASGFEGTGSR